MESYRNIYQSLCVTPNVAKKNYNTELDEPCCSQKRRRLLGGVASAGIASITGFSGHAMADERDISELGSVRFAEFGLRYESDVDYSGTTCQMSLYHVNSDSKKLQFHAITQDVKELIQNNDAVLADEGFEALPTAVRGNQSRRVTTRTNNRLKSVTDFRAEQPLTHPNAQLSIESGDVVLQCQGNTLRVASGESDELELKQTTVRPTHTSGNGKMFPVLELSNYGQLDVTAATTIKGDSA